MTARHFARSRPKSGTWTCLSPYTGVRVRVASGVCHGNKVTMLDEDGHPFEVDACHKVERRDRT